MTNTKQVFQSTLTQLSTDGADAARIARRTVAILHAIDAAMAPIISQRGVSALYQRSLFLIRPGFPWLVAVYEGALVPGDFSTLQTALAEQSAEDAMLGTTALLNTFHDLLSSLIGESLTERLLGSICDTPSSGDAVQDITS
ncbi:MAG: hypothetical protein ABIP11_08225 [Luteimonas sp.]